MGADRVQRHHHKNPHRQVVPNREKKTSEKMQNTGRLVQYAKTLISTTIKVSHTQIFTLDLKNNIYGTKSVPKIFSPVFHTKSVFISDEDAISNP